MEQSNAPQSNNQIVTGGFANHLTSPSKKLWIIVILLSLLIPPLGIVAAALLVFKGLKLKNKKLYLMAVAAVVSTLVSIGGLYLAQKVVYQIKLDRYKYTKLDDYKLTGNLEGTGISFKKPVEFKEKTKNVQLGISVVTFYPEDAKSKAFGVINAVITNSALAKAEGYPETLGKVLETKGEGYAKFEETSKGYLKSFLPKGVEINVSQPTPFKNSSISKNAWLFTFVASGKIDGSGSIMVIKGISILAVGKQSFYNFSFASVDYNWSYNQKVWQQTLDSLKIDQ